MSRTFWAKSIAIVFLGVLGGNMMHSSDLKMLQNGRDAYVAEQLRDFDDKVEHYQNNPLHPWVRLSVSIWASVMVLGGVFALYEGLALVIAKLLGLFFPKRTASTATALGS